MFSGLVGLVWFGSVLYFALLLVWDCFGFGWFGLVLCFVLVWFSILFCVGLLWACILFCVGLVFVFCIHLVWFGVGLGFFVVILY